MREDDDMSEQDRRMAEYVAQAVVARILSAVQDDEVAGRVMDVWGGKLDRTIGRGLRRLGFYVVCLAIAAGAVKFGLIDKFWGLFKP
jgi:hypothetical protein